MALDNGSAWRLLEELPPPARYQRLNSPWNEAGQWTLETCRVLNLTKFLAIQDRQLGKLVTHVPALTIDRFSLLCLTMIYYGFFPNFKEKNHLVYLYSASHWCLHVCMRHFIVYKFYTRCKTDAVRFTHRLLLSEKLTLSSEKRRLVYTVLKHLRLLNMY